jgi:DNA polymerase III delta' subunit
MQGALALQDWLIATILCTESNHDPCGLCHSCELFQAGHHPDFLRLQPEGKAQWIKVDAVRELNQFCQATAQQGVAQVVTLESADRLNTASANALLKTLEEPPAQTFLVLQTAQPGSLLPTIRSRSQRVLCPQPTVEQSQSWLLKQGVNAEDADRFLRLSKGAPLQALEWAQSDQEPKHDRWLQLLLAQCKAPRLSIADIQSLHADEVSALLQIWLDTIRQMIRFVQSKEPEYIAHLQPVQDWAALCETYTSDQFWQQLYDQAVLTQQQLQRPNQLNANLLLEQLWLRMAKQCLHAQSRVSA